MTIISDIKLAFYQVFLIAKKDFKYLFLSPMFFIFVGVSFIFLSYTFPRDLFQFINSYAKPSFTQTANQGANIHFSVFVSYMSYLNLILLFVVPIFTMKLLAEEKRNHTFDLLMTSPISSLRLVLGKYLALLMILGLFLILSLIYPLSTWFWIDIPIGPLFSTYLGLFFLCAVYGATGLFASSLSVSLFLSAFIGMILNIGLWFISQGQAAQSSISGSIMDYLSFSQHLTNFVKGSLTLNSFVFFISLIIFFIFFVVKVVEISKWRS